MTPSNSEERINGERIAMKIARLDMFGSLSEVAKIVIRAEKVRSKPGFKASRKFTAQLKELSARLDVAQRWEDKMNDTLDRAKTNPQGYLPLIVYDSHCDPEWRGNDIWNLVAPVSSIADYLWIHSSPKEALLVDPDAKPRWRAQGAKMRQQRLFDAVRESRELEGHGAQARIAKLEGITPQRLGQIIKPLKDAAKSKSSRSLVSRRSTRKR